VPFPEGVDHWLLGVRHEQAILGGSLAALGPVWFGRPERIRRIRQAITDLGQFYSYSNSA
jgi:hypothetical protein